MAIFLLVANVFMFFTAINTINAEEIVSYEYGAHATGEQLAYHQSGFIPPHTTIFHLNVAHSEPHLSQYTFLRVEYTNAVSRVLVKYNKATDELTFMHNKTFLEKDFTFLMFNTPAYLRTKLVVGYNPRSQILTVKPIEPSLFKEKKIKVNVVGFAKPLQKKKPAEPPAISDDKTAEILSYQLALLTI